MIAVSETARFFQNRRVACRVYDGLAEVITLDQPIRQHRLNRTATRLWELAAQGATVEQLVGGIMERFDVDAERAASDVRGFVVELVGRGILIPEADAAGGGQ